MSDSQQEKGTQDIRAFVLCGGLGTRLRPVLNDRPKSMALVAGTPFLELLLRGLRAEGIREVVLGTGYMAEQIEGYFHDGKDFDLSIRYSREEEPLGTGGALKLAEQRLSDPVVVLNGDSYVEWKLVPLLKRFKEKAAAIVIVLQAVSDVSRYGSVIINAEGRVLEFVEKGTRAGAGLINAGVYLLRREVVAALPAGKAVSLEKDVVPERLSDNVYGIVAEGLFIDIGIPADLERAQTLLAPSARSCENRAGAKTGI